MVDENGSRLPAIDLLNLRLTSLSQVIDQYVALYSSKLSANCSPTNSRTKSEVASLAESSKYLDLERRVEKLQPPR